MRPVDADALSQSIQDGPGTEMQKFFADVCVSTAPTLDVAPIVHGRWVLRNDKGTISMTHPYMCNRCGRTEMFKEPYCNCGAKMDEGTEDDTDGNV